MCQRSILKKSRHSSDMWENVIHELRICHEIYSFAVTHKDLPDLCQCQVTYTYMQSSGAVHSQQGSYQVIFCVFPLPPLLTVVSSDCSCLLAEIPLMHSSLQYNSALIFFYPDPLFVSQHRKPAWYPGIIWRSFSWSLLPGFFMPGV